jgi:DNA-binding SARP family transcriptional activator
VSIALLDIRSLGEVAVVQGGDRVPVFVTQKEIALLIYLACTRRPHTREALAELLWDDRPHEQAAANLRTTISRLRRHLAPYLVVTRKTVAFDVGSPHTLDTALLKSHLDTAQADPAPGGAALQAATAQLDRALQLYQADFLAMFHLRSASGFDEWATVEREHLRQRMIAALTQLIDCHERHHQYAEGIRLATRLLELDALDEAAHRQMMRLLVLNGQRCAALAHYDACRRILAAEFGVEPEPATVALQQQIRAGELSPPTTGRLAASALPALATSALLRHQHNLPSETTPFFGRERELAWLRGMLQDPVNRLVTVTGPGGVGKTRVVLAAVRAASGYEQGVCFVPLAERRAGMLAPALADALGLALQQSGQLIKYLRDKQMLLVLDSMEHLLAEAGLIGDLLRGAPRTTILISSREPLGFQAEYVLRLEGLPTCPVADDSTALSSSSVQLFAERAQRSAPCFTLGAHNLADVVRTCELVEGLPLAIELAAAWAKRLAASEIAAAIARDPDFLTTALRDVPARHRSMREVFEDSWRLLSAIEQRTLVQVAEFGSIFSHAMALASTAVASPVLDALVDKSLLRRAEYGWYQHRVLLRPFALEKLGIPELRSMAETRTGSEQHRAFSAAGPVARAAGECATS